MPAAILPAAAMIQAKKGSVTKLLVDQEMDFADACLVRMSELARDCQVWTVDGDFKVYRRNERLHIPLIFPD